MKIDAHQHFWIFDPVRDAWITEDMKVLRRNFLPEDLLPDLLNNGFDGCVAVQAAQTEEETNFLLDLAKENSFIKAVVGWVDLLNENVEETLENFTTNPILKGIRHIVQAEAPGFMGQKSFLQGIKTLSRFDLTYDILIFPPQLEEAIDLVTKFPNQPFVVDHLAKPNYESVMNPVWVKGMKALSERENVYCKLSGLVTETKDFLWTADQFVPYIDFLLETFGVQRVMFGSDWPVCLLASTYKETVEIVENFTNQLSDWEQDFIWGQSATDFYKIENTDSESSGLV